MKDIIELERVFEGVDVRDILKRVATGTTTVEDAERLERVFDGIERVFGERRMRRFYGRH